MNAFHYFLLTFCTFLLMEGITWCTHKFVMHGFLWYLHDDHHSPEHKTFEKNDFFFLIFAIPCFSMMYYGYLHHYNWVFYIGLGVQLYGLAYFLIHDVLIHQRFSWFNRTDNIYFRALRKAHKIHHKKLGKEDGECFGMLFVPFKYFKEAWQYNQKRRSMV
ncbi:MAG: sterol desaturase family protein [Chitinophagaceae bacterium]|nr:sterol desaturase family protein [Chitinophagaceae bacterium]